MNLFNKVFSGGQIDKQAAPDLSTVMVITWSNLVCVRALGKSIGTTSGGLNLEVSIKNVNNRNDTSHMAVISMDVLLRGTLTLGMFKTA